MKYWNWTGVCALLLAVMFTGGTGFAKPPPANKPITLVVMDPLSKELACACVKGYGQRDYRKLAARLEAALKQQVNIEFSDDLADTMSIIGIDEPVVVIGDHSIVAHGARTAKLKCQPIAELTGLDGKTTVPALVVARADDPIKELREIAGRTVLVGLPEHDAKHAAAQALLRVDATGSQAKMEQRTPFTDAALDVLDSSSSPLPVAIVPGYALPLLEGCGTMKKGDLKVIGNSEPVPFITAFAADNISAEQKKVILQTLLNIKSDAEFLEVMESKEGFKPINGPENNNAKPGAQIDWPDWRGPNREARVPRLPSKLPAQAKFVWKKGTMQGSLAGLSISGNRLILAERDFNDEHDVYRCLDADSGSLVWRLQFPARGQLDYGQSPRATPVIRDGKAYLLGAFGDLRCVNVPDGKLLWERQLVEEFGAELPTWGTCATPLIVDDLLIVNPGATNASLAALDCTTGRTRWTTPGHPAAYASFIYGTFGGRPQIVGYDEQSLGGWDARTGERLWRIVPAVSGDFNVPTPIAAADGIVVSTENNGTRFYRFDESGRVIEKPSAAFPDLSPDTATPVASGGRVFGLKFGLRCLDLANGLKQVWHFEDDKLGDYATFIADDERVLVISAAGELILLDGKADHCAIISRLRIFEEEVEVYSHAALIGSRLYLRGGSTVACIDLSAS